ncbi:MAG: hypothetical protein GX361_07240 [Bacteroidales bacterium]|nr:hypothetical protein [Bacteroidales bacterium]
MLTREQCLQKYGSDYFIQQKVEAGELFRLEKGIYSLKEHVPEIALLSFKYPQATITMNSAFYVYGITDVIPDVYDLATTRDAAKIPDKRVKQYFVEDSFFEIGIEQMDYKGYSIRIYSRERMLIELLRYKSKLSYDYYKELILSYRRILLSLNIQKIQDIALAAPKSNKILETLQSEVL